MWTKLYQPYTIIWMLLLQWLSITECQILYKYSHWLLILFNLWQIGINECSEGTSGCSQICSDTDGSYLCSCQSGYQLDTNNHTCNDINECTVNNGGCQEMCQNTNGSYGCLCPAGYSLDNNNVNCTGVIIQTTCCFNKFQQILMSVASIMVAVAKAVLILLVLISAPVILVIIWQLMDTTAQVRMLH